MKKAILFGASGFVGSYLLEYLLADEQYSLVTIVVRKPLDLQHPKLNVLIGDIDSLPTLKTGITADDVFIALGTTKKKTPDEQQYYRIDHDYPVTAAAICKAQGATAVFVVSAVGANTRSGVFYVRTKGEMERDMLALAYEHTHIFRPSMILGSREEKRPAEKFFIGLFGLIDPLMGSSKYRGTHAKDIARAMIAAAKTTPGTKMYHWKEMKALL